MIRPCEIHWQLIRVEKNICIIYICVCAFSISGHSCSDFKKSWKPFDRHRPAEIKYEAELSFGNVCHTLLIVVFKMNNRNPKLGQFPDLFLHNAAERRNYQNTSIGVCTITSQSIWYSKTLDILSSFQRPLAELWWHYALRKAIPKLRLAPVSRIYGNREKQSCKTSDIVIETVYPARVLK